MHLSFKILKLALLHISVIVILRYKTSVFPFQNKKIPKNLIPFYKTDLDFGLVFNTTRSDPSYKEETKLSKNRINTKDLVDIWDTFGRVNPRMSKTLLGSIG